MSTTNNKKMSIDEYFEKNLKEDSSSEKTNAAEEINSNENELSNVESISKKEEEKETNSAYFDNNENTSKEDILIKEKEVEETKDEIINTSNKTTDNAFLKNKIVRYNFSQMSKPVAKKYKESIQRSIEGYTPQNGESSIFKERKENSEGKAKNTKSYIEKMTVKNRKFLANYVPKKDAKIKIIPLGGLNAIGMNITLIEDEDDIIIIDCGNAFPTEDLLGIDLVIPDVTYLKKNYHKIRGLVLTHGHEDHIGAIPYILKDINVPIYGTKLTLALVEGKLKEHKVTGYMLNTCSFSDVVKLGNIYVEFIRTNHSIVDSAALAIYTKAGIVMHTGDFKVDYTPVFGDSIDLNHFAEIGKKGVLALLSDSTNATKSGFTMSESTVGKVFDAIFNEHINERIIVSTFASNVDRVRQVIDTASRNGRKVAIEGRSMINIINIATELGYINIPKGTLIPVEMLKNHPDNKTVIITTGSQGESMAALSRMAQGTNKKINIKKDDLVILSSSPIPGNEKAINRIIDELYRRQANVIFQDTHVSGHACAEELKLIYTLIAPTYAIPVHGEYRHRKEAAILAESVGVKDDNCLLLEIGDVLEICEESAEVIDHVASNGVNVDGLGVGDVGNIVLKDRQALANGGMVIIAIALSQNTSDLISGPDIISKGFIYMRESEDLIKGIKHIVKKTIYEFQNDDINDWKKLKAMIISEVGSYLWKNIKRDPLIMPIIIGV